MSASDEEAFASAEEGEEQTKTSSGKSSKAAGSSKGAGAASKDSSKQKGKQQQQRKKKGKGAVKSAADEKESSEKKKPTGESSAKAQTTGLPGKGDESPKKTEAASARTALTPKDSTASKSKSPESVTSSTKDSSAPDSSKNKQDLKDEVVKSAQKDESSEGKSDTLEETTSEETKAEAPAKSAGEIRQSLSENTTEGINNPVDQEIPRETDGAVADSGKEQDFAETDSGNWGWGWGSSILSAATNSLETFSTQVGEGLTTIIDTVESSLGVPPPEDLVRTDSSADLELDSVPGAEDTVTAQPHEKEAAEEVAAAEAAADKNTEDTSKEGGETEEEKPAKGGGWLSGWGMSNISSMGKSLVNKSQSLMNTGFEKAETLASGGLDILETIGKKTYSTLTDHDPGLRRAREFLLRGNEKPSLSSVLREAQERAEQQEKMNEEAEEARKVNFTALFEDNQGMAHVEALEMLSNRSERKVQSLLSAMEEDLLEKMRPQLVEMKDIFQQICDTEGKEEEESEHDFSKLVTENLSELHLGTAPDKLNKVQENVRQWIADFYSHEDHSEISDAKEVYQRAVQSLADVTSKAVEQFHKAGELVLLQKDEDKTYSHRAQSLAKLATVLITEVDILASKFSHCLNKIGEEKGTADEVKPMVTSVYVEAGNASGYIQDAFQLLLPVLQHATIQSALASSL